MLAAACHRLRPAAGRATPAGIEVGASAAGIAERSGRLVRRPLRSLRPLRTRLPLAATWRSGPVAGLPAATRTLGALVATGSIRKLTTAQLLGALPATRPIRTLATAGLTELATTRAVEAARGVAIDALLGGDPIAALELLRGRGIAVAHAAPVLGVELPLLAVGADVGAVDVDVLVHVDVGVPVVVAVIASATAIVVVVHVDVVAAPVEGRADERSRGDASAEAEHARGHRAARRGPEAR